MQELTRSSYNDPTCSTPHKQQNSSQQHNFALHEQWLIFTFAKGDDNSSQTKNGKVATDLVFMIGRHVSALVVKHVQDVAKCLRWFSFVNPSLTFTHSQAPVASFNTVNACA